MNSPLVLVDPTGMDWGYYDLGNGEASIVWFEGKFGKYKGRQYSAINFGKSSSIVVTLVGGSEVEIFKSGGIDPLSRRAIPPSQGQSRNGSRDDSLPEANQAVIRQVAAQPFEKATAAFAIASVMQGAGVAGSSILLLDSLAATGLILHEQAEREHDSANSVAMAANTIEEAASKGQRFGPNQDALIQLAKEAKRGGVTPDQAKILIDWASEYGVRAHGPEMHPNRPFGSQPISTWDRLITL